MAKKGTITRIRTLYAILIGVVALCIGLFIFNVVTAADPIGMTGLGNQTQGYGVIITDLQSSPDLYRQNHLVDGLHDSIKASANISRFDISILADKEETLASSKATWCTWLQIFSVLAALAMTVFFIMALISFYIYARRGKVFPTKNIRWLTWAGILMIAMSLGIDISTYLERTLALSYLEGSNWQPSTGLTIHTTRIFFGLTIIFLAEIFKIGRAMQEEQELTI